MTARRVREAAIRADQVRVGDGLLSTRGLDHWTYSPVVSIGLEAGGVRLFRLADGTLDRELPGNRPDVLVVGR